jgi:hypothetical protein
MSTYSRSLTASSRPRWISLRAAAPPPPPTGPGCPMELASGRPAGDGDAQLPLLRLRLRLRQSPKSQVTRNRTRLWRLGLVYIEAATFGGVEHGAGEFLVLFAAACWKGETKKTDGSDAKGTRIAYVASRIQTPEGMGWTHVWPALGFYLSLLLFLITACSGFLGVPILLPHNCFQESVHISRKVLLQQSDPILPPHNFFQENHQYF